jgi:hypothetical protein
MTALPSTTKEQRGPMYEDVVPLVVPGFLTARCTFGKLSLGVRSLSENDLSFLRAIAKESASDWPLHVASASIWSINGIPLLESYPYSNRVGFNTLSQAHKSVARSVFSQALSFFARMKEANRFFESFLYENESRRLWKGTNNGAIPIWDRSGFPGTERLGMNSFQSTWVQWNRSEDDRASDDYQWSLTKVLVSVQSSKSAKKLDGKDRTRVAAEKDRRAKVQDNAYYRFIGVLDDEGKERDPARRIHQPRTAAELSEEMRRWVAGEQDFHDKVVSDYKERVRLKYETKEAEKERAIQAARERRAMEEQVLGVSKPTLVGYTLEQLRQLNPVALKPGAKFITEADPTARNFNRYLRDPIQSGLEVRDGKVAYREPSTNASNAPKEDDGLTLNERIARRKTSIHG